MDMHDEVQAIYKSLKALSDKTDWLWLAIDFSAHDVDIYPNADDSILDMDGPRAVAWLENNLLCNLRIPFGAFARRQRRAMLKYPASIKYYMPGKIPPMPLTGWHTDFVLEVVVNAVRNGASIYDAFHGELEAAVTKFLEDLADGA